MSNFMTTNNDADGVLNEPLLSRKDGGVALDFKNSDSRSNDDEENDEIFPMSTISILAGSVLGSLAAVAGLYILSSSFLWTTAASQSNQFLSIASSSIIGMTIYAMIWSGLTAIVSYLVFHYVHTGLVDAVGSNNNSSNSSKIKSSNSNERSFTLGVFGGFGATCVVHDALHGVPIVSLSCTILMAVIWGMIMATFDRWNCQHCLVDDDNVETISFYHGNNAAPQPQLFSNRRPLDVIHDNDGDDNEVSLCAVV